MKNQKALITGASSGVGAVYADRLAKRGLDLILVARELNRPNAVATRVRAETGRSVEVVTADLAEKANIVRIKQIISTDDALAMVKMLEEARVAIISQNFNGTPASRYQ